MHAPVFLPDGEIDIGKVVLLGEVREAIAEAGAKYAAQCGLGHEEVFILHGDHSASGIDAGTWHDAVDVWMEVQALVPCMENHGEAACRCAQPAGVGECIG